MTNLCASIGFTLDSLEDFENRELAEKVLETLLGGPSFAVPTRYGVYDPVRERIRPDNVSGVLDLWTGRNMKSGDHRSSLLQLVFCRDGFYMVCWDKGVNPPFDVPRFHSIDGSVPLSRVSQPVARVNDYLSLILALAGVTNPAFGIVQSSMTPYWDVPYDLTLRLPDVPWGSIYGKPYIEMFGRERLLSAPFHSIRELPSGHIFAQLTESVLDPELPEDRRKAVREWLGEDCFMVGKTPPRRYASGKAPDFDWPEWARR